MKVLGVSRKLVAFTLLFLGIGVLIYNTEVVNDYDNLDISHETIPQLREVTMNSQSVQQIQVP